jgi:hypothetical protein
MITPFVSAGVSDFEQRQSVRLQAVQEITRAYSQLSEALNNWHGSECIDEPQSVKRAREDLRSILFKHGMLSLIELGESIWILTVDRLPESGRIVLAETRGPNPDWFRARCMLGQWQHASNSQPIEQHGRVIVKWRYVE